MLNNRRTWLPREIFDFPPHGNVHDSLLPAYAGFSPLTWALLDGEREVGVTAHLMDAELDAGDIVLQRAVPVGPRDTGTDPFHKTVAEIPSGHTDCTQQDRSKASFFHKRSIEQDRLEVARRRHRAVVRAQSDPYPNALTFHKGQMLRIVRASVSQGRYGGTPGRIFIREGDGVVIVAGEDARHGRDHGLLLERGRLDGHRTRRRRPLSHHKRPPHLPLTPVS